MTLARFAECLSLSHWTQPGLAVILKRDERHIQRRASDKAEIPTRVAAWLETLGKIHGRDPASDGMESAGAETAASASQAWIASGKGVYRKPCDFRFGVESGIGLPARKRTFSLGSRQFCSLAVHVSETSSGNRAVGSLDYSRELKHPVD